MSFASLTQQLYKLLLQSKVNAKTIFIAQDARRDKLKKKNNINEFTSLPEE